MATLQQPLPLNHPPPQPTSQPPRKKLRPRNAKPKLTLEQITQNDVVQSALRIGRHARANAPKPGEEPQALDNLLTRMAGWAHQVAPHYSLAEFVVAAQGIAGNRELRPMLGVFRLAELRDVTGDHNPHPHKNHTDGNEHGQTPEQVVPPPAGPVHADVGPDDDDWDELDIVPAEAVEVRSAPNLQSTAPSRRETTHEQDKLAPEVDARIDQNRRAALERRKSLIARLNADKASEESSKLLTKGNDGAEKDSSTDDVGAPSPKAREVENKATEAETKGNNRRLGKSNSEEQQQTREAYDPKVASSTTETDCFQKAKSINAIGESRMETLTRVLREEEKAEVPTRKNENSSNKEDNGTEQIALPSADSSKRAPLMTDLPQKAEERKGLREDSSSLTGATEDLRKDKAGLPNLKESKQATVNSNNSGDEDIDMEILAEFNEGDDV